MTRKYLVICAGYNCYKWIDRCLQMLAIQDYPLFDVCVIDDASTDERQQPLIESWCKKYNWKYILKTQNEGALKAQYEGIMMMEPQNGDVLVFCDLDDCLADRNALSILDTYYDDNTPLTYGNYKSVPYSSTCPIPGRYPVECEKSNDYRNLFKWGIRFNHLRTIRWEIYKRLIPEKDFMFNGEWMKLAPDTAVFIPALEMSGGLYKFIPDVLYCYNSVNPISEWRKDPHGTDEMHAALMQWGKKEMVIL